MEKTNQILPAGVSTPYTYFIIGLRNIDRRYFVYFNKEGGHWEIICPIKDHLGEREEIKGVYTELNDKTLDDLRRRKKIGLQLMGDMRKYKKWLQREQDRMIREEAWKRQEIAQLSREHELNAQVHLYSIIWTSTQKQL